MKKLFKYIPIVALFAVACNPMDEVYDELDARIEPYREDISYTLAAEDYKAIRNAAIKLAETKEDSAWANSIQNDLALNQKYSAADFVAPILGPKFPALNLKSSCLVTYNVFDKPAYLFAYEGASTYKLAAADYTAVGGDVEKNGYFFPSESGDKHLSALLLGKFPDATADQYAYVTYNQADEDPAGSVVLLNEAFDDYAAYDTINKNGWKIYSEAGAKAWQGRVYDNNPYAQASAFGAAGVEIFYMISPAVDLSASTENMFSFDVKIGYWNANCLQVVISEDFDGTDVEGATWTDVSSNFTFPTEPTDGYGAAFAEAGKLNLSDYTGTIHIAFKYVGDGANDQSTTYQIDNVLVKGVESAKKSANADYAVYNDMYKFNGTIWTKDNSAMVLDPADYQTMGISSFSSSNLPANYLPVFLGITLPFAQEGDLQVITYEFNATLSAVEYSFTAGSWAQQGPIFEKADQFVYGDNGWVFDPTIKLEPTAADYQLLVDYVYTNLSREYGSTYGNDEFYFGASAYYLNFDLRLGKRADFGIPGFDGLDTEAAVALTWDRVEEGITILLGLKYPDAVEQVSGINVYYWVTFKTYENDLAKRTLTGIFKYVEGTGFVRDLEYEDQMVSESKLKDTDIDWNR
ncbi:MAG: choice-of-anchor J domain-containing protein [Salinivirgaceae bacterium]